MYAELFRSITMSRLILNHLQGITKKQTHNTVFFFSVFQSLLTCECIIQILFLCACTFVCVSQKGQKAVKLNNLRRPLCTASRAENKEKEPSSKGARAETAAKQKAMNGREKKERPTAEAVW